ncbi:glutamate--tRNA ligase [Sphingomonas sp. HDW15A]|uniref:glutamate--tRNA ligase n=1 Tax=Sphingomonas sp. HDW15A TaxID=2714942 RepID=UPI0014080E4A|nr:glutamate--tRNA ligase [Sphingomonas sp. HDW15A]QIK97001.1 glutamate--tRNA ligase [Sphingomonas sp. HDW15A]
MAAITRFAPSPTGKLHVGNIRTALHNYLLAAKHGGKFLLRIDDTDLERSNEEHVASIVADLDWLGLIPNAVYRQSERFDLYEREFEKLKAAGRVYACYETPEELDLRRKVLLGRGLPPVYERKPEGHPVPEGVAPHWRFKLDHDAIIEWTDLVRGPQHFDPKLISDPVIRRADESWLYLLPSVIDDIDLKITHVLRGEDHVTNSAIQVQMFLALGAEHPVFAHAALLVAPEGKLSKRLGSSGVEELRAAGIEPMAINSLLARLGTSQPVEAKATLGELALGFDLSTFGRAPAHFDPADVEQVNRKLLHHLDYSAVADRLPEGVGEAEWALLAGNIDHLGELDGWLTVLDGDVVVPPLEDDDRAFLAQAADAAEAVDWSGEVWTELAAALKDSTGRKGKALFRPLRLALTGRESGPEMAPMLARIGRERSIRRLRAAAGRG